jgi:hypothetical protein
MCGHRRHLLLCLIPAPFLAASCASGGCALHDYYCQVDEQREFVEYMRENKLGVYADPEPWTAADSTTMSHMASDLVLLETAEQAFFATQGYFTLRLDELRPHLPADAVFELPDARVSLRYLPDYGRDGVEVGLQMLGNPVVCSIPILPARRLEIECVKAP